MGTSRHFTCETCRVTYFLGSSFGPNQISADTVKEYDAEEDNMDRKKLEVNSNLRKCLLDHTGHNFHVWGDEYTDHNGDDLVIIGAYGDAIPFIEGEKLFDQVDLSSH